MSETEQNATENTTWEFEGKEYPLFAFDKPVTVKLTDGTIHKFKKWTEPIERQREDLLKSIVTTSPANVHGENPMDIKTDFTKSVLRYYDLMIEDVGGFAYPGDGSANSNGHFLNAHSSIDGVRVIDMIRPAIRRAAASRLYGGKYEVEKPDTDEADTLDYDPFDVDSLDITEEVKKQEARQQLQVLTLSRVITIRHEIGVEQLPNGRFTPPTNLIRYHFTDPDGADFSKWEMKAQKGFAIQLKNGGTRAETYYDLDTIKYLFNKLIDKIEGASIANAPVELPTDKADERRKALLAEIPLLVKKNAIVQLFREANQLGNA